MPYYYAEPTGALLQHSNKAFKFKQRLHFKRYTFSRTRGFNIVIRHSLPTKASFQKVYFFLGHPVQNEDGVEITLGTENYLFFLFCMKNSFV